jgi:hypothetical protein
MKNQKMTVDGRDAYKFSHGHYPKGFGLWAFLLDGKKEFWYSGMYSEAVAAAKDAAGWSVKVLS